MESSTPRGLDCVIDMVAWMPRRLPVFQCLFCSLRIEPHLEEVSRGLRMN